MIDKTLFAFAAILKHIGTNRDVTFFLEALFSPKELAQIPKRLECLKMISKGEVQRVIADKLKISIGTVTRVSNIYKYLQKENPRWWIEFKERNCVPTEPYKDDWGEMGVFLTSNEKRKWLKRRDETDTKETLA